MAETPPPFDPGKPFTQVDAPAFDPSKPFTEVGSDKPSQRGAMDMLTGQTGPRYKTWPERAFEGAVQAPKKLMDASNVGYPGSRESIEALVGPSFEAATIFSPVSVAGTAAKAAAPAAKELLGMEGIRDASRAAYKNPKFDEIEIRPDALAGLRKEIETVLQGPGNNFRNYETSAGGTFKALEELTDPLHGRTAEHPPTLRDILNVRDMLQHVRSRIDTPDAAAAKMALQSLDKYLNEIPTIHVTKGNPAEVKGLIEEARQNWLAYRKLESLQKKEDVGIHKSWVSGKAGNMDNAIRQRIRDIVDNPKESARFSKDELDEMKKVMKGGFIRNSARWLSLLDPFKHGTTALPMAFAADMGGGMGLATLGMGVGIGAQKIAESQAKGGVQGVMRGIQERAPANAGRTPPPPALFSAGNISPQAGAALRGAAFPPPDDRFNPLINPGAL